MKRITFIGDTHAKHDFITKMNHLPGGDILIHTGDVTRHGYFKELEYFCEWFDNQKTYEHKIFIAGNHELCLEDDHNQAMHIINYFQNITYLEDNQVIIDGIKIWGTPWQPRFYDWAFNLDRNGDELKAKWDLIPEDVDILLTHGPAFGILDNQRRGEHMGCELLAKRLKIIKPKIHAFGHNHYAYGYKQKKGTLHINDALLDEKYFYTKTPITIDWDYTKNKFKFL